MSAASRPLPHVSEDSEAFWRGGEHGHLYIYRCADCRHYIHPPVPFCPKCESREVAPEAVSGRGTVASFTVNHHQWFPNLQVPYAVALIELEEQADVRLPTNIINCPVDDVHIGMKVRVTFEQCEDIWLPLFEPDNP